ncbi:MAG: hypothetical protein RIC11_19425 [Botrimarina sp.]
MQPIVIRLLGAVAPKTDGGTKYGAATAAEAALMNRRRLGAAELGEAVCIAV